MFIAIEHLYDSKKLKHLLEKLDESIIHFFAKRLRIIRSLLLFSLEMKNLTLMIILQQKAQKTSAFTNFFFFSKFA